MPSVKQFQQLLGDRNMCVRGCLEFRSSQSALDARPYDSNAERMVPASHSSLCLSGRKGHQGKPTLWRTHNITLKLVNHELLLRDDLFHHITNGDQTDQCLCFHFQHWQMSDPFFGH